MPKQNDLFCFVDDLMLAGAQRSFKLSVTPAQRAQAEHLLKAHQAFLSDLWGTRSRLLADMTVMLAEECAAPFSVPARILRLSEQVSLRMRALLMLRRGLQLLGTRVESAVNVFTLVGKGCCLSGRRVADGDHVHPQCS